jgi:putative aldouronate transport system substrate-binding protein
MIHPDAASNTVTQMIDMFYAGQTGAMTAGFGTWYGNDPGRQVAILKTQPDATLEPFMPVGFDGGEPFVKLDPSFFGTVGIPSKVGKDKDRLQELLRICDYLYPPFGSNEYIFLNYGLEGTHHTIDENGDPKINDKGLADIANLIYGFLVLDLYIYHPGYPEQAKQRQQMLEVLIPQAIPNPTLGLYSPSQTEKGPALNQLVTDTINDVVYGRKSTDELQKMQDEWRSRGGDDIRKEYEALLNA